MNDAVPVGKGAVAVGQGWTPLKDAAPEQPDYGTGDEASAERRGRSQIAP